MNDGPLSALKVVEFSQFISGPWCAKALADFGAKVIKVEEPGVGDQARSFGPFPGDIPHSEKSGLFQYLNTNKLGLTLNLRTAAGLKIFKELIKRADILVENNPPRLMKELGINYGELQKVNPKLIMTSITPFGQTGPYCDYKANDLIIMNIGYGAYLCPFGVEDLEKQQPLKYGGYQADFAAAGTASLVTMFGVFAQRKSGQGEHLDISAFEVMANQARTRLSGFINEGTRQGRLKAQRDLPLQPLSCKDGYIYFFMVTEPQWDGFREMIGPPLEWVTREIYPDRWSRNANWEAIEPSIKERLAELTREELVQGGREHDFPIGPVNTSKDVVESEQLAARGFFAEVEHPELGKVKLPGLPYQFSRSPWRVSRPAPLLGQHNEKIICQRLGYSRQDLVRMRQAGII